MPDEGFADDWDMEGEAMDTLKAIGKFVRVDSGGKERVVHVGFVDGTPLSAVLAYRSSA